MTLAEELADKYFGGHLLEKRAVAAINDAIEKCAEVAESGGVNVADPETASRLRALKG